MLKSGMLSHSTKYVIINLEACKDKFDIERYIWKKTVSYSHTIKIHKRFYNLKNEICLPLPCILPSHF